MLEQPSAQRLMRTSPSWGPTILRIAFGLMIAAHGGQELFGWFGGPGLDGFIRYLERRGVAMPEEAAMVGGLTELIGGIMLVAGFQVRLACIPLVGTMIAAAHVGHGGNGFFTQNGGWEYPAMCGSVFFALFIMGGGAMSLDERFSNSGSSGRSGR